MDIVTVYRVQLDQPGNFAVLVGSSADSCKKNPQNSITVG